MTEIASKTKLSYQAVAKTASRAGVKPVRARPSAKGDGREDAALRKRSEDILKKHGRKAKSGVPVFIEAIRALAKSGLTTTGIATGLKLPASGIRRYARLHEIDVPREKRPGTDFSSPAVEKTIIKMRKAGASVSDIQQTLKCKRITLIEKIHQLGLKTKRGRPKGSTSTPSAAKGKGTKKAAKGKAKKR